MAKRVIYLLLLIGVHSTVFSQVKYSTSDKKALKYYAEAREYLRRTQFYEAIEPLQKAVGRDPNFIEGWKALGSAYNRLSKINDAIASYDRSIEINPQYHRSLDTYFVLGEIHYSRANYEKALDRFIQYSRLNPGNPKNEKIAEFYVRNIRFALTALENPLNYDPVPLSETVNQFKLQYFPVLTVDQQHIFFTARKGIQATFDENIYQASRDSTGNWMKPFSISNNINSQYNEGACTISADGRTLIFTACNGRKGYGNCDLYITRKLGDTWSIPENIGPEINTPAWEAQPSLSADGRILYFVSNRTGGVGAKDIWVSKALSRKKWSAPVNLGTPVNTVKDEISPFIHVNGESLYFSSKGHVGMGGYDIYLSEKTDSVWSIPKNLGFPLNDHSDQVSLYITSDGAKGYYTVEKFNTDEISSTLYLANIPEQFRIEHKSDYLNGHIKDAISGKYLSAAIQLFDLSSSKLISSIRSDELTGEFTIVLNQGARYGIYVGKKGYIFKDFAFDYDDVASFDARTLEIELEPIKIGVTQALNNIYFDLNSYALKPESYSELDFIARFLKINKLAKVQIGGHTDDLGTEKYNYELSVNRAKAVYDYLLKKRIPRERLAFKGFGDSQPVAPNDSDENRSKNRRIEFEIVKF